MSYFLLFRKGSQVKAARIQNSPEAFSYENRLYLANDERLDEYSHLLIGTALAGFQFPFPEHGSSSILTSRLITETENAHITDWGLEIHLKKAEDLESDLALMLCAPLFSDGANDHIIVVKECQNVSWVQLAFELETEGIPMSIEANRMRV